MIRNIELLTVILKLAYVLPLFYRWTTWVTSNLNLLYYWFDSLFNDGPRSFNYILSKPGKPCTSCRYNNYKIYSIWLCYYKDVIFFLICLHFQIIVQLVFVSVCVCVCVIVRPSFVFPFIQSYSCCNLKSMSILLNILS